MFLDNLLLWIHVAAAIFFIGPATIVTSSTPRYIRNGELGVVRFLRRSTRLFGLLAIVVFLAGIVLGRDRLAEPWLTASMTLFIVAIVLLFAVVARDQSKAIKAMAATQQAPEAAAEGEQDADTEQETPQAADGNTADRTRTATSTDASVQTARIGAFSGVIGGLWLVILVLMVWQPGA